MTYWAPIAIGLLILLIMLLPVVFLIFSAILISKKLRGAPSGLLVIGAILLAIASLESPFNYSSAYLLNAQTIAVIIVYTSIVFDGLHVVALILMSIGLIKLSKMVGSGAVPE